MATLAKACSAWELLAPQRPAMASVRLSLGLICLSGWFRSVVSHRWRLVCEKEMAAGVYWSQPDLLAAAWMGCAGRWERTPMGTDRRALSLC